MSDDDPRDVYRKTGGAKKNPDAAQNAEPLIVTIEPQAKNKYSYEAKTYRLERARYRLEKKAYRAAHWTVVFLVIYTTLTLILAVSSIISTRTANRNLKEAYRPRLLLTGIDRVTRSAPNVEPVFVVDGQGRFAAQVILPNTGMLVAKNVRFFRFSDLGQPDQFHKLDYQEILTEDKIVAPRVDNVDYSHRIFGTRTVSESETSQLQQDKLWAIFSVLVSYDDDFGTTHHTEYCGIFALKTDNARKVCPWPIQDD